MGRGQVEIQRGPSPSPNPEPPEWFPREATLCGSGQITQADWVSGHESRTWFPLRDGEEVLGMRPKPSYENWDTFHMGPVFFTSFLHTSWEKGVCLHLGPGRTCQVGAHVGLGEALGHRSSTSSVFDYCPAPKSPLVPARPPHGVAPLLQKEPQSKHHVYFEHSKLQKQKCNKTHDICHTHARAHTLHLMSLYVQNQAGEGAGRWVTGRMH